jgi:sec-independent protein translocase protein TatB
MFLDPGKLLVILIVALVVLGPDKLPGVARQLGAAWGELRRFRERLETEVRGTFPDLPSTHKVAQAVRSPLAFLDQLADAHEREQDESKPASPGSIQVTTPKSSNGATDTGSGDQNGQAASTQTAKPEPVSSGLPGTGSAGGQGAADTGPSRHRPPPKRVGATRPWRGIQAGEPSIIPDDPSMN